MLRPSCWRAWVIDYPEITAGSRLASKARKLASKLTPAQRREHFNGTMAMIY
jgi:hypothetical protein